MPEYAAAFFRISACAMTALAFLSIYRHAEARVEDGEAENPLAFALTVTGFVLAVCALLAWGVS